MTHFELCKKTAERFVLKNINYYNYINKGRNPTSNLKNIKQ